MKIPQPILDDLYSSIWMEYHFNFPSQKELEFKNSYIAYRKFYHLQLVPTDKGLKLKVEFAVGESMREPWKEASFKSAQKLVAFICKDLRDNHLTDPTPEVRRALQMQAKQHI